ncbi:hypothetical protein NRP93_003669 [Clostridium botulinum]|nr:hypothetical protein [Clostridium botulinum]
MTFLPLIIFICILALAMYISRKNYKNRKNELINNLKDFNEYIKNYYYSMEKNKKEKFISLLNKNWKENFISILNHNFYYANNVWAIQKQIATQEELFSELKNFNERTKTD